MHLDDSASEELKAWVVKRLEDISDADSDVLADYVIALIKSDESDDQVKQNCQDNLLDFLHDSTPQFVNDVFAHLENSDSKPLQPTATAFQPTAPAFQPSEPAFNPPSGPSSRKRDFNDSNAFDGHAQGYQQDRPMKQMRRGGRGGQRGGFMGQMSGAPQSLPPFDPNNPMAALMAMQQAMGLPGMPGMPGMPQMPFPASPGAFGNAAQSPRSGQRCHDYDTKGFCALGASCPHEHGNDPVLVPQQQADEYDPTNASLSQGRSFSDRGRGRGRGRGDRGAFRGGRGGRADFSSAGPNHDRSITQVVVEQIPQENFNEQSVRDFFSEFGTIESVELQDYKRLAIIKFEDYDSAKKAYDSPKVIFDNRFVKVYWYKPERMQRERHQNGFGKSDGDVDMQEEEKIDPVEFAKKQEEAQRAHEEKTRKIKEAEAQRQELEQKMKAQAEERNKLLAKLAAKERGKSGTPDQAAASGQNGTTNGADGNGTPSQTDALKAKLAELEREAESMGINPNEDQPWQGFAPRGRGGYRGRGGFQPRGAWRGGRGGFAPRGGAVRRLDNRPRTVAVVFPNNEQMDSQKDEALRQYLLFSDLMESTQISPHPSRSDAAMLAFSERYQAEKFLNHGSDIPHLGKVELSWMANPAPSTPAAFTQTAPEASKDVSMDEPQDLGPPRPAAEMDYDVADDDDNWLVEQ
ncbi:hypothetical protein QM012_001818 [Aureobasidium pullulans]|uniref:RNA-binding domain-containing protein n=1 Tax=Aureobasidium pullulans TaxID=5580 RepID=A0ABR0TE15_AURPU